jgi:hypothetical protein
MPWSIRTQQSILRKVDSEDSQYCDKFFPHLLFLSQRDYRGIPFFSMHMITFTNLNKNH